MLASLITKAFSRRQPLFPHTNAFRLINGAGDQLPGLVADVYNRHWLLQIYDEQPAIAAQSLADALIQRFEPEYLIIKNRTLPADTCIANAQVIVAAKDSKTIVLENGLNSRSIFMMQ